MSAHTPPEGFEVPVPEIDREIYAMPMFRDPAGPRPAGQSRLLRRAGLRRAGGHAGTERVGPARAPASLPVPDLLLVPAGNGATRVRLSFAHTAPVEELDAVDAALREVGGGDATGPRTTPWPTMDLDAHDPRWSRRGAHRRVTGTVARGLGRVRAVRDRGVRPWRSWGARLRAPRFAPPPGRGYRPSHNAAGWSRSVSSPGS